MGSLYPDGHWRCQLDDESRSNRAKESTTKIATIGIDLAKSTMSVLVGIPTS